MAPLMRVLQGLNVLYKYYPHGYIEADSDEIWVGGDEQVQVSPEDLEVLKQLDFDYVEEENWQGWILYI